MLLDEFDRTEQVFPDMMHILKNVIVEFHSLFIGLTDTVKLRNTEKQLGRFGDACNVNVPDSSAMEDNLNAKGAVTYNLYNTLHEHISHCIQ